MPELPAQPGGAGAVLPGKGSQAASKLPVKPEQPLVKPEQTLGWADGLQTLLARDAAGPAPVQRVPQIIYTSRTHSQLAQVIGELKRTSYRCARHADLLTAKY